jgi:hypothetical protein
MWNFSGVPTHYGGDLVLTAGTVNDSPNNGTGPTSCYGGSVYIQGGTAFCGGGAAAVYNYAAGDIVFQTGYTAAGNTNTGLVERMRVKGGTGYVGIGTGSPGYALDVSGTIRATADVIAYSDRRVKANLRPIQNALDKLGHITGYTYTRIDQDDKEKRHAGVVAQEVLEVLPEVVYKDSSDRYNVAYGNLTALLIEAIKELKERIKILEQR